MEEKIRQFLQNKIKDGFFSGGSVLFGKTSKPVLCIHEGTLAKICDLRVNSQTAFDLQSITKALATACLFLAFDEKKIFSLDESIDTYIPKNAPNSLIINRGITFRHLLCHSSGLSDADLEGEFMTPVDLWKHMFSAPLHFEPGTSIEYSDLGYRILGKILEIHRGRNLEGLSRELLFFKQATKGLTYHPIDPFNVAGCPNFHGLIDDEQVRFLGGVLGCDGLFGTAESVYHFISDLLQPGQILKGDICEILSSSIVDINYDCQSFFDTLACGPKTLGWEVPAAPYSYAGKFHSDTCFEKAGGAGTFIWFDPKSQFIFVYLTNYGKPLPFDSKSWNQLVQDLEPHTLSNIIYENV